MGGQSGNTGTAGGGQAAQELVRDFAEILTHLLGHDLGTWMTAVRSSEEPALRSFVAGLPRELDAVTAGLTLPYSSGAVEGHVNRIKMLKGKYTDETNLDLLGERAIHAV